MEINLVENALLDKVIRESAEAQQRVYRGPRYNERVNTIYDVITQMVKEEGLVIYGGMAIERLVKNCDAASVAAKGKGKEAQGTRHTEDPRGFKDIEFYSSSPLTDSVELCNRLYALKDEETNKCVFESIRCDTAHHKESYTFFVDYEVVANVTYAPKRFMKHMPTVLIEGVRYTHPIMIFTDMLRVYNDLLRSSHLLKKCYSREMLLRKFVSDDLDPTQFKQHFEQIQSKAFQDALAGSEGPAPVAQVPRVVVNIRRRLFRMMSVLTRATDSPKSRKISGNGGDGIPKCVPVPQETVLTGMSALAYYLKAVDSNLARQVPVKDRGELEYISIDILSTFKALATRLQDVCTDLRLRLEDFSFDEYRPFFQYYGHRVRFKYNGIPVLTLYSSNNHCLPYRVFDGLKVATHEFLMMQFNQLAIRAFVEKNEPQRDAYVYLCSFLRMAQRIYLESNHLNKFDDHAFQEKVVNSFGSTSSQHMEYYRFRERLAFKEDWNGRQESHYVPFSYSPKREYMPREAVHQRLPFNDASGDLVRREASSFIRKGLKKETKTVELQDKSARLHRAIASLLASSPLEPSAEEAPPASKSRTPPGRHRGRSPATITAPATAIATGGGEPRGQLPYFSPPSPRLRRAETGPPYPPGYRGGLYGPGGIPGTGAHERARGGSTHGGSVFLLGRGYGWNMPTKPPQEEKRESRASEDDYEVAREA